MRFVCAPALVSVLGQSGCLSTGSFPGEGRDAGAGSAFGGAAVGGGGGGGNGALGYVRVESGAFERAGTIDGHISRGAALTRLR